MSKKRVHVLGVCGSLDPESRTRRAVSIALEAAEKAGATVKLADLTDYQLPLFKSSFHHEKSEEHIAKLRHEFQEADGVILGTAEYHGSLSGALKNALDWIDTEQLQGKVVGLIGVAGGGLGATNALTHLRTICRQLYAWVLPEQISIANSHEAFDAEGMPHDRRLQERLQRIGEQVVHFAQKIPS